MTTREVVKGLRRAYKLAMAEASARSLCVYDAADWGDLLCVTSEALGSWETYRRFRHGPNADLWLEDWRTDLCVARHTWVRFTTTPCPF